MMYTMHENLDIELLQTLVAISDAGSFGAAANTVHRTQSAVSMQMKRLEEIVGAPLFEKHGRRSVLTVHGQNLLLYARRMLSLQQEALASFRSSDIRGEVSIGVCDDYVMSFLPPILSSFAQLYPNAHIRLDAKPSRDLVKDTQAGDLDFSLVNIYDDNIKHEELRRDRLGWVTSPDHLAHEKRPLVLALENNCPWSLAAQRALDQAGVHYRIGYTTFNNAGVTAIVDAGLAVSVMCSTSVPPHLRVLSEAEGFPMLPFTKIALVMRGSELSPAALKLADTVRQRLVGNAIAA